MAPVLAPRVPGERPSLTVPVGKKFGRVYKPHSSCELKRENKREKRNKQVWEERVRVR